MAETTVVSPLKRYREQETLAEEETTKRQKPSSSSSSYNQILCLLNDSDEQNQPNNDLSSFINALQQEISTDNQNAVVSETFNVEDSPTSSVKSKEEDIEDNNNKEKVMQHLLEASDDELGIPNTEFGESNYEKINDDYVYGSSLLDGFGDAFWEFEDEAANYYTLLQSELFM